jgi:hypothetical protein
VVYGLAFSGSGWGPVAASFEHGNELTGFTKGDEEFLDYQILTKDSYINVQYSLHLKRLTYLLRIRVCFVQFIIECRCVLISTVISTAISTSRRRRPGLEPRP